MILHSFVMRPVPHLEIVQVFPSQPRNRQYAKERKYQGILRVYIYIPCSRTVAGATLFAMAYQVALRTIAIYLNKPGETVVHKSREPHHSVGKKPTHQVQVG